MTKTPDFLYNNFPQKDIIGRPLPDRARGSQSAYHGGRPTTAIQEPATQPTSAGTCTPQEHRYHARQTQTPNGIGNINTRELNRTQKRPSLFNAAEADT